MNFIKVRYKAATKKILRKLKITQRQEIGKYNEKSKEEPKKEVVCVPEGDKRRFIP